MRNYGRRYLRESVTKAALLKAIAKAPKTSDAIDAIFEGLDGEFHYQILRFGSVSDWMSSGDFGAEDCFWTGLNSKMPPSGHEEYVLYDVDNDEIIGINNRKFTMAKLAKMIGDAGFTIEDEDEVENLIDELEDL